MVELRFFCFQNKLCSKAHASNVTLQTDVLVNDKRRAERGKPSFCTMQWAELAAESCYISPGVASLSQCDSS